MESHKYLMQLKRKHKVTIREMSKRMGITLIRIRYVLANGAENHYVLRDWVQAITGTDPGSLEWKSFTYWDPKKTSAKILANRIARKINRSLDNLYAK